MEQIIIESQNLIREIENNKDNIEQEIIKANEKLKNDKQEKINEEQEKKINEKIEYL